MMKATIGVLQWAAAVYCLAIASVALVAPHAAGGFYARADLRAAEGVMFLAAGLALVRSAVGGGRVALWTAHLTAGALLCLRGVEILRSIGGIYLGPANHILLGLGVAAAPLAGGGDRGPARRDWISFVAAAILMADAVLILHPPEAVSDRLGSVKAILPWFGVLFPAAAVVLAVALGFRSRSERLYRLAHVLAGSVMFAFPLSGIIVNFPRVRVTLGSVPWLVLGLAVAVTPWAGIAWPTGDTGSLRIRLAILLGGLGAVPLIGFAALLGFRLEENAREHTVQLQESVAGALSYSLEGAVPGGAVPPSVADPRIGALLARTEALVGGEVYILDASGSVVARSPSASVRSIPPPGAIPGIGSGSYRRDGLERLVSTAQLQAPGWKVVIDRPEDVSLAGLRRQRNLILAVLAGGVLAAALLGTLLARRLSDSLRSLAHAAARLADGDTSVPTLAGRVTEIEQVRLAFDKMRSRLVERTVQRDQAEARLLALNQELENRVNLRTAELAAANRTLTRANEDLRQFSYAASHDLKAPLRHVSAYSQLLAKHLAGKLDPAAEQYLSYCLTGARRMNDLLRDLIAYLRAGESERHEDPSADGNTVVQAAVHSLRPAIAECAATVIHDDLPALPMHRLHLMQMLENLIGNAIKYRSPARPLQVRVSVERRASDWVLSVADNGIGIAAEHHQRIFGLFQRVHGEEREGTGIGLAICQKIAERYGGRIWVESEEGAGSVFAFSIPAP